MLSLFAESTKLSLSLPRCLSCRFHNLLSSTPPPHCNYSAQIITAKAAIPISNWSQHLLLFSISSPKPISRFRPFSLYTSDSHSSTPVNEEQKTSDTIKLRVLMQKAEVLGINTDSCTPGRYNLLICPQCKGGQPMEKSLSFHITENGDLAMWRCFRVECGWAGQAFADKTPFYNGVNKLSKVNCPGLITVESLGLVPLGEKLIAYFSERMISKNTLQRNAVMQISGDQNVIAFNYIRDGVLVTCKYRSLEKKYRQEKGTEKILYGLDDIKEADEIIIVEGEMDKLSMEEAGFLNCVSVPDGAPQKVSAKELPFPEKDYSFQYLWNCKEYLDKASRIILATDGDKPGEALAEELARRLGRERCWRVSWPKKDEFSCFKDANEVLKNFGSGALRDVVENAELLDSNVTI